MELEQGTALRLARKLGMHDIRADLLDVFDRPWLLGVTGDTVQAPGVATGLFRRQEKTAAVAGRVKVQQAQGLFGPIARGKLGAKHLVTDALLGLLHAALELGDTQALDHIVDRLVDHATGRGTTSREDRFRIRRRLLDVQIIDDQVALKARQLGDRLARRDAGGRSLNTLNKAFEEAVRAGARALPETRETGVGLDELHEQICKAYSSPAEAKGWLIIQARSGWRSSVSRLDMSQAGNANSSRHAGLARILLAQSMLDLARSRSTKLSDRALGPTLLRVAARTALALAETVNDEKLREAFVAIARQQADRLSEASNGSAYDRANQLILEVEVLRIRGREFGETAARFSRERLLQADRLLLPSNEHSRGRIRLLRERAHQTRLETTPIKGRGATRQRLHDLAKLDEVEIAAITEHAPVYWREMAGAP